MKDRVEALSHRKNVRILISQRYPICMFKERTILASYYFCFYICTLFPMTRTLYSLLFTICYDLYVMFLHLGCVVVQALHRMMISMQLYYEHFQLTKVTLFRRLEHINLDSTLTSLSGPDQLSCKITKNTYRNSQVVTTRRIITYFYIKFQKL